jgi:hypothetical protein
MLRVSPAALRSSAPQARPRVAPRTRHAAAQPCTSRYYSHPKPHRRVVAPPPRASAANNGRERGGGNFTEAHAAVDALLAAAAAAAGDSRPDKHARLVDAHASAVAALGARLGLDRVVPSWNAGAFAGHAVSGRLRAALDAPLSLPALSFGVFTQPQGRVTLRADASSIVKSEDGGYAVRSAFTLAPDEEQPGAPPVEGVNSVMGTFTVADDGREMAVQFDRVSLELLAPHSTSPSNGAASGAPALNGTSEQKGSGAVIVDERELAQKPARVTLRVLLMTPDVTVTRSSLGSLAVLKRRGGGGSE